MTDIIKTIDPWFLNMSVVGLAAYFLWSIKALFRDLKESIYRYPVEVGIWQSLGDAYMRANRLKEALEAYNKAEELIR